MPHSNASSRGTGELTERVCYIQLQVFRSFFTIFCTVPCLLLIVYLLPKLASFMAFGAQTSSMTVLKLLMLVPIVVVFVGIGYIAVMLAAVGNVFVIRLVVPQVRGMDAHTTLMQFYSHPRWINFLWGGMAKNKRLNRWCECLSAATIDRVYGRSEI
ncbi:MAG TPA: hypothetical protein VNI53_10050 [Gammaproteobacteria bacterium]|nr:hypothetical protein [Gammaproteobacteria bacterium]